jgi:hypothetical protein
MRAREPGDTTTILPTLLPHEAGMASSLDDRDETLRSPTLSTVQRLVGESPGAFHHPQAYRRDSLFVWCGVIPIVALRIHEAW